MAHPGLLYSFGQLGPARPGGTYVISADYQVRAQPGQPDTLVVTRRSDQRVVRVQAPPAGPVAYRTTFAGISGEVLVVGYETAQHVDPTRALLIDLATGTSTPLDQVAGATPMSWSTAVGAVVDGVYYYLANAVNETLDCVGEVDLASLRGRTVECGKFGDWLKDLHATDDGASWLHFHGSSYQVCREGRTVHSGVPAPVGPVTDCGTFDTTVLHGWQLWGTAPLGSDAPATEQLAATDGRTTVPLGVAAPRSLLACGGYAYWLPDPARHALVRWRPGGDIEQVLRDDSGTGPGVAALSCADRVLTVVLQRPAPDGLVTVELATVS